MGHTGLKTLLFDWLPGCFVTWGVVVVLAPVFDVVVALGLIRENCVRLLSVVSFIPCLFISQQVVFVFSVCVLRGAAYAEVRAE